MIIIHYNECMHISIRGYVYTTPHQKHRQNQHRYSCL